LSGIFGFLSGWTPNSKSEILDVLFQFMKTKNGEKPKVVACHAGLECGILGTNYPDMDMISFGPTIHGAHSLMKRAVFLLLRNSGVLEILEPVK
jgi:dipeptidase D